MYTELTVSQMINSASPADLSTFMRKQKLNLYDFPTIAGDLIPKLQLFTPPGSSKNPLLKRSHLKELFDRQPWCVITFKALGTALHKKVREKPDNMSKILGALVRHIEYSLDGGEFEQWMFLLFVIGKVRDIEGDSFTFPEFLDKQSPVCMQTWQRVILGGNLVKIIHQLILQKRI